MGAAVARLLAEQGDEIERATGHRLRIARALVRDPAKERSFEPGPGVLTTNPEDIVGDASLGLDPAHHLMRKVDWGGRERHYYEIAHDGRRIWGATAAMIVNLSRRLELAA